MPAIDLTGRRFSRLVVIARTGRNSAGIIWECACDCGGKAFPVAANLLRGHSKSCGCISKEMPSLNPPNLKHGMQSAPEYRPWIALRTRCNNPLHRQYPQYGGRGITVCKRWDDFENFLADMGPRPSVRHTIDRYPDNDGNYEPGNCRWATWTEQANNRRNNRFVEYKGQSLTLAEARRISNCTLPQSTFQNRLKRGWDVVTALEAPRGHRI